MDWRPFMRLTRRMLGHVAAGMAAMGATRAEAGSSAAPVIVWGSPGRGDGQFKEPRSLAIEPGGSLLVVDSGNERIQRFSREGIFLSSWGRPGSGPGEFTYVSGIAVDATGDVYVTETGGAKRVQRFSPSGRFREAWAAPGITRGTDFEKEVAPFVTAGMVLRGPRAIAIGPDGTIYTAWTHLSNGLIRVLSSWICCQAPDGAVTGVIDKIASDGVHVYEIAGLAVDRTGRMVITETDRYAMEDAGDSRLEIVVGGFEPQTPNPIGPISTYASLIVGRLGTGSDEFRSPAGVAFGRDGEIYVADAGLNRVQKLDPDGRPVASWGRPCGVSCVPGMDAFEVTAGNGIGEFSDPHGIAVDDDGTIFVADTGNHRIVRIDQD